MSGIDAYLDSLATSMLTKVLVAWNTVTIFFERVWGFTTKSAQAILDAHKEEIWVFRERNEVPWVTRGEVTFPHAYASYYPASNRFTIYWGEGENVEHRFDTVVLARIYNSDRTLDYDMSSFFHSFRWTQPSREYTQGPSLHEMALLFFCAIQHLYNDEQMDGFTLDIMLSSGDTIRQRFNSTRALRGFTSWEDYKEREIEQEEEDAQDEQEEVEDDSSEDSRRVQDMEAVD